MGKSTLRLLTAGLLAALLPAGDAAAQRSPAWTLAGGRPAASIPETHARGYAAVPASALTGLGAELAAGRGELELRFGEHRVRLQPGSPFLLLDGSPRQLVHPVYEQGGVVYLPVQFLVEYLPQLSANAITVDVATRTLRRQAAAGAPATTAAAPRANPPAAPAPPPAAAPPRAAPGSAAARRLVVIDPGHGGVDPGARGPSGVREKDVALAVSRRLAALLREDPTLEVRMTRERDTLIALTDRTRKANGWRADGQPALFMSIHTNAHPDRSVRGFETFFLSEAKTEDARRVAEMENAAQQYENPGRKLDPLSFILHDLRQNKYLRDSSEWAAMVQERLGTVAAGPNRGVKQAGFVVLNGAFMPAVLVELGFISHPQEERLLADPAYQERLARQLARSVHDFFERSATPAVGGR